ncbi:type II toxin-antitoxin system PemK/MazF family toxin [Tenggerimyces flavus]|uniref:Type II toxin-antitoxin system PemK/MazF family toxin n=1 Tax=Tenggerimyces flavus TaxID=1708749 RepID=A0ABV7YBZ1_9ACTN|nr:type II toxin-antitoxin system PemK/MazF family toxin [Tenggerimyces flavus]
MVWAVLDEQVGRKPYLIVSNNRRNEAMDSVLAARVTTSSKPSLPSIVELGPDDPLVGRVLCDEVMQLWNDEIVDDAGALSPPTMERVADGLRHALGL